MNQTDIRPVEVSAPGQPHVKRPTHRADIAYEALRDSILSCELKPNARLRLEELRDQFQLGISPIREALMRLEMDDLVRLERNKGFSVARVSPGHLKDSIAIRSEVEKFILHWAIERGDVAWEANLISAFHLLSRQQKYSPDNPAKINPDWNKAHRYFHLTLVSGCNAPSMFKIYSQLEAQTERYVALAILNSRQPRDDNSEHKLLMDAALERNVELVQELSEKHIQATEATVLKVFESGLIDY